MAWIDAHIHLWTSDVGSYPLAGGQTAADLDPPDFTPEMYLRHARPSGIEKVVIVQTGYHQFDNSYATDAIKRFPDVFSVIGIVDENEGERPGGHGGAEGPGSSRVPHRSRLRQPAVGQALRGGRTHGSGHVPYYASGWRSRNQGNGREAPRHDGRSGSHDARRGNGIHQRRSHRDS